MTDERRQHPAYVDFCAVIEALFTNNPPDEWTAAVSLYVSAMVLHHPEYTFAVAQALKAQFAETWPSIVRLADETVERLPLSEVAR